MFAAESRSKISRFRDESFSRKPRLDSGAAAGLFADDLYDDALFPLAIELRIEHPLPGPQIQLALCDRQGYGLVQQQTFEVRIAIVFSGFVVAIVLAKRGEFLQPFVDILNQSRFVVVHVDGCGNVHRRYKGQAFLHSAFLHGSFYLGSDVDVVSMLLCMEL